MFLDLYLAISEYVMDRTDKGFDFVVGGYQINTSPSASLVLFANRDGSWSRIVISYIITSRNDFFFGSFAVSNYQLISSNSNQYTYKHPLNNWSSSSSHSVYQQAHISGLRTAASKITTLKIVFQQKKIKILL